MKNALIIVSLLSIALVGAGSAQAATFTILNGDVPGEGLNDPTAATPVGGNTGTTLGEQRLILLQSVADVWAARIDSSVDIVILARFNPINSGGNLCGVLGQTSPGDPFMNFPGAPVPNVLYHGALADAISGVDQDPGFADFFIVYNSYIDTASCATVSFYYGLDSNVGPGQIGLFSVVLHEMAHGLGFASFINPSNGAPFFGTPGIFDYFILDMTTGLHWTDMTSPQRMASAINTGNLTWDGPNVSAAVPNTLYAGDMDLEVTAPPAIAGTYDALGANFGQPQPLEFTGEIELVQAITGTPSEGCDTLTGFTPGNIALIDRLNCEFGVKALNAQNAGASAAIIANDRDGTVLVLMGGGVVGDQVTIPVAALGQDDGATIKAQLPGVSGVLRVMDRLGAHSSERALLYAPPTVNPGSSVSHFDAAAMPDLLMEPAASPTLFDEVDMTPDLFVDIGHTVFGADVVFIDDFESGTTDAWDSVVP